MVLIFFLLANSFEIFTYMLDRGDIRTSNVTGMTRAPDLHTHPIEMSDAKASDIICFLWNDSRFCIFGKRIFTFQNGRLELFLDDLPLKPEDQVKVRKIFEFIVYLGNRWQHLQTMLRMARSYESRASQVLAEAFKETDAVIIPES